MTAPMVEPADAVRLTALHKSFGDVTAVDGIDLTIRPGEVVALLGPNGAGKTTTIDMILGLSGPTSGEVSTFGMSPRRAVDRGLVTAVMQTGGLLPDITVRETVELTGSLFSHRIDTQEAMRRGHHRLRLTHRQEVLRRPAAAPALRHGTGERPGSAHPR